MEPLTVSVKDAGRLLSIGKNHTYNLINAGKLDVVKLGRRTLVVVSSIERLVGGRG